MATSPQELNPYAQSAADVVFPFPRIDGYASRLEQAASSLHSQEALRTDETYSRICGAIDTLAMIAQLGTQDSGEIAKEWVAITERKLEESGFRPDKAVVAELASAELPVFELLRKILNENADDFMRENPSPAWEDERIRADVWRALAQGLAALHLLVPSSKDSAEAAHKDDIKQFLNQIEQKVKRRINT